MEEREVKDVKKPCGLHPRKDSLGTNSEENSGGGKDQELSPEHSKSEVSVNIMQSVAIYVWNSGRRSGLENTF